MKHVILGFLILLIAPFVARRVAWLHGRGFAAVFLATALGQIVVGICNLGGEGVHLSDAEGGLVFMGGLVLFIVGIVILFTKRVPRRDNI